MSTFIQLLAIASLTLPAAALAGSDTDLLSDDNDLAFNDDLDFETELTRGKTSTTSSKKKADEATPALPTFEEPQKSSTFSTNRKTQNPTNSWQPSTG